MRTERADIIVVGAGSGGFGAALRAGREAPSARVVLIEGLSMLGGTSTAGGVNNWEPGVAGFGANRELYARLSRQAGAIGVGRTTHFYTTEEPYGLSEIDPDCPYERSLRRSALAKPEWRRVHFEPDRMSDEMAAMLRETGNVEVRLRTRMTAVRTEGCRVTSIVTRSEEDGDECEWSAKLFIDCSGGVHLAKAAGCATAVGEESAGHYGEPSAPDSPAMVVNGASLIYRVEPAGQPADEGIPDSPWTDDSLRWVQSRRPATAITLYPNGDMCMNPLPVMEGAEFYRLPYREAKEICENRVRVQWAWLKEQVPRFRSYRFKRSFPLVGIRETDRLVGRDVLAEQDVRAGTRRQRRRDEIIACADHALDTHGHTNRKGPRLGELEQPYGVPYSALLPREYDNLITASRGSSFSHIAASSCRLSRTMMELGEAAGTAAALALDAGSRFDAVSVPLLRERLRIPEYLDWIRREWRLD